MKECLFCKKQFKKKNAVKFCSKQCYWESLKGKPTWNTGTKGLMKPNKTSFKKGQKPWNKKLTLIHCETCDVLFQPKMKQRFCSVKCRAKKVMNKNIPPKGIMPAQFVGKIHKGEKNGKWKGNNVGYYALHHWLSREYGSPQECEFCGDSSERKYEWANISGEYKRERNDWIRLCTPCHRKYDYKNNIRATKFQLP